MKKKLIFILISLLSINTNLFFAQNEDSKIEVMKISENIYKLFVDDFVNMIAFAGPDGVLLVDSGFEETAEEVKSILTELGNSEIKYIINTHSDYDHIAGNRSLRENALVIAHTNCKDQMLKYIEPSFDIPFDKKIFKEGLPMIKIEDRTVIYFNDEEIHIIPILGSHTDEDIVVYFKNEGIVCLGDIILPDSFPHVKVENGGSVQKLLANIDTLINNFSKAVLLIVGHGRDMKIEELKEYRKMIFETNGIVVNAMKKGKGIEEMKRENILKDWEAWNSKMFPEDLNTDSWIDNIYKSWIKRVSK
jgi:glyoxylase-like metal-dependent hydrolase (beta-lactamase superfamily II)